MKGVLFPVLLVALIVIVPAFAQEAYEVGSGDVLQIIVLGQTGMTGEFPVDTSGVLSFPFLGKVKAAGMSISELERKLTTLLADGYLRRPQVAITVKEYRSQRVYVTGEVMKPGPYGLRPERSLMTLVQQVGELTPNVGHEVIVIRPPAAGAPVPAESSGDQAPSSGAAASPRPGPALPGEVPGAEIFRVNLRELRSGYPDKDMRLQVGDTVYFPKASQVYITGHVARPGAFRYEEGMTVFQALALAGSVTDRGSAGRVKLTRMVDGKRKELHPKMTDPVLPEDTLHVPERFF